MPSTVPEEMWEALYKAEISAQVMRDLEIPISPEVARERDLARAAIERRIRLTCATERGAKAAAEPKYRRTR